MKPLIKWAGGKRHLLDEITELLPPGMNDRSYHEPMIGGGALFFRLGPQSGTINDLNEHLIRFYRAVRDRPEEVIDWSKKHTNKEERFYELRELYNRSTDLNDSLKASLFLYFNQTSYNGLWRVNSNNEFNVPFGGYEDPDFVKTDAIRKASEILSRVEIYNKDFSYVVKAASPKDIVYFDPPYDSSSSDGFTSYTKEGFTERDQVRLRNLCIELDSKNVGVIVSSSKTELIMDLYSGLDSFSITEVGSPRRINCVGDGRGRVTELLIYNTETRRLA